MEEPIDAVSKIDAQLKMRARLLDIATEAIIARGLDGKIIFWNSGAEETYGWARDEALGRSLHQLLQTSFPISFEQIETQLREKRAWQGRLTQSKKNGERIIVECRKNLNEGDDVVLEVNRDITAEIRSEELLRSSDRLAAMGRVAGIIAHEINNPLSAITNIFFLLHNHPAVGGEARSLITVAEQELERVSHITRQTLSFYRESSKPVVVFVPEILEDVLELQQRLLTGAHINVRKRYESAAPIMGFPAELRQVFLNLVGNAIQAMNHGGTLGVYARDATDWTMNRRGTMISVVDTGTGIKPQDSPFIFQPFFSTKSVNGTGLGLWISRGIVQKYEGRISFRTLRTSEGNFTCFRVFLPGMRSNEQPVTTPERAEREHRVPLAS